MNTPMKVVLFNKKLSTPWYLSGGISASNCIGAYAAKGSASQAASYINLANPGTYDLTEGKAPSWNTATGWTFTAASMEYLKTGIIPNVGWSMIIRISMSGNGAYIPCGNSDGTNGLFIFPRYVDGKHYYSNGATLLSVAGAISTDTTMSISALDAYLSGASDGTIGGTNVRANVQLYVGAMNTSGATGNYMTGNLLALSIYNTALTPTQMSSLHTAMMAL